MTYIYALSHQHVFLSVRLKSYTQASLPRPIPRGPWEALSDFGKFKRTSDASSRRCIFDCTFPPGLVVPLYCADNKKLGSLEVILDLESAIFLEWVINLSAFIVLRPVLVTLFGRFGFITSVIWTTVLLRYCLAISSCVVCYMYHIGMAWLNLTMGFLLYISWVIYHVFPAIFILFMDFLRYGSVLCFSLVFDGVSEYIFILMFPIRCLWYIWVNRSTALSDLAALASCPMCTRVLNFNPIRNWRFGNISIWKSKPHEEHTKNSHGKRILRYRCNSSRVKCGFASSNRVLLVCLIFFMFFLKSVLAPSPDRVESGEYENAIRDLTTTTAAVAVPFVSKKLRFSLSTATEQECRNTTTNKPRDETISESGIKLSMNCSSIWHFL